MCQNGEVPLPILGGDADAESGVKLILFGCDIH